MIGITVDIDWAPDEIVNSLIELFNEYDVPVTLYCTDHTTDHSGNSSVISNLSANYELGLHPNFMNSCDYEGVFQSLMKSYPQAKGFRSHNGCTGWPIAQAAHEQNIKYEVYCTVYHQYIHPFKINADFLDYFIFTTYFFDSQMLGVQNYDWDINKMWFYKALSNPNELYILGFHPNILYYDMGTYAEYCELKSTYHVCEPQKSFKTKKPKNSMRLLLDLLNNFSKDTFTTPYRFGNKNNWSFNSLDNMPIDKRVALV